MNNRKSRNRKPASANHYELLEPRQLMAGVTLEVVNGVNAIVVEGTDGNDVFEITADESGQSGSWTFNDEVGGFGGNVAYERIIFRGRGGNDTFINDSSLDSSAFGHDGNDTLRGGSGHNRIQGGDGNDQIYGGDLNDSLRGGSGNDFIDAGKRHDRVFGGDGNDVIVAGAGNDIVMGEAGADSLFGGNGNDRLNGGAGSDLIRFGDGPGIETAIFDAAFASYAVETSGDRILVTDASGQTDDLADVDVLEFSDIDKAAADFFVDLSAVEQESLRLVNQTRTQLGRSVLELKPDLTDYAQSRAENVLAALGPNPTPQELFDAHSVLADIQPMLNGERTRYLENLAYLGNQNLSPEEAARRIHDLLVDSPVHYSHMINAASTEIGVGIFKNAHGWYLVHSFFET